MDKNDLLKLFMESIKKSSLQDYVFETVGKAIVVACREESTKEDLLKIRESFENALNEILKHNDDESSDKTVLNVKKLVIAILNKRIENEN